MMLEGLLLGLLHRGTNEGLGVLSDSISAWDYIDPHLLMFAFLPPLLFGGNPRASTITRDGCSDGYCIARRNGPELPSREEMLLAMFYSSRAGGGYRHRIYDLCRSMGSPV